MLVSGRVFKCSLMTIYCGNIYIYTHAYFVLFSQAGAHAELLHCKCEIFWGNARHGLRWGLSCRITSGMKQWFLTLTRASLTGRWQLKYFWNFHPYLGKISNFTSIFFRWVGSTTNLLRITQFWIKGSLKPMSMSSCKRSYVAHLWCHFGCFFRTRSCKSPKVITSWFSRHH